MLRSTDGPDRGRRGEVAQRGMPMAWETRKGRRYYYAARKRAGRVVKRYCGGGVAGEVAAELEAEARRLRAERAAALERERARLRPADAAMAALDRACALTIEAELVAAGYHRVNFMWRRRRARRDHDGGGDGRRG